MPYAGLHTVDHSMFTVVMRAACILAEPLVACTGLSLDFLRVSGVVVLLTCI